MKKTKKEILKEYIEAIITALLIALIIRAYVVQAFKIPSGSMIPTLLVGDHLLVNKFIYGIKLPFSDRKILVLRKPQRGDIIVFKYPEDPSRDFIKRVIAVEGDLIEERNKIVYINGQPLNEPYVLHTDRNYRNPFEPRDNFGPYIVPKNKLFVMGDNRDQSYDSRYWGYVDLKDVKGKAMIIYWSWDSERNTVRLNRIGRLIK
ncbi:MAG: signal peptidase I [Thermodesulfovibrionales bacterium]|nr:signal peptidase I [Thermodesulfovibrionales bacterium]